MAAAPIRSSSSSSTSAPDARGDRERLRQVLTKAGVEVPADVNLELAKYLNNRGVKKLNFKPELEFKDPYGVQGILIPEAAMGK